MSRLLSAKILPGRNSLNEIQVEFTWQKHLIPLKDWRALSEALQTGDIPKHTYTETRVYASPEIAERAIEQLMPKVGA